MTRLPLSLLLLLLLSLCACHTQQYKLASEENKYYDVYADYQQACPTGLVARVEPCLSFAVAKRDFERAADALKRGGSIAPQLTRVKKDMKDLQNAIRRSDNSSLKPAQ